MRELSKTADGHVNLSTSVSREDHAWAKGLAAFARVKISELVDHARKVGYGPPPPKRCA